MVEAKKVRSALGMACGKDLPGHRRGTVDSDRRQSVRRAGVPLMKEAASCNGTEEPFNSPY